jgi:hypothetical protein
MPLIAASANSDVAAASQPALHSSSDLLGAIDSIFADDFGADSAGWMAWKHHPRL